MVVNRLVINWNFFLMERKSEKRLTPWVGTFRIFHQSLHNWLHRHLNLLFAATAATLTMTKEKNLTTKSFIATIFVHPSFSWVSVVEIGMLKCPFPVEATNSIYNKPSNEKNCGVFPHRLLMMAAVIQMENQMKVMRAPQIQTKQITFNFEIYGQLAHICVCVRVFWWTGKISYKLDCWIVNDHWVPLNILFPLSSSLPSSSFFSHCHRSTSNMHNLLLHRREKERGQAMLKMWLDSPSLSTSLCFVRHFIAVC